MRRPVGAAVQAQRGFSLLGLLFWAVLVGLVALIGIRVFPTVNEYLTIQRAINKISTEGYSTVPEIRAAFDKQKDIEYAITSISGREAIKACTASAYACLSHCARGPRTAAPLLVFSTLN